MLGREVFSKVENVFSARGLEFPVSQIYLKQSAMGIVWLLIIFDFTKVQKVHHLTDPDLIHHINLELRKFRLIPVANSRTMLYAIPLDPKPVLPEIIERDEQVDEVFQIGRDFLNREIAVSWENLGHVIVAGMTGSGKSVFMRSLTNQAIHDGFQLALIDLEDRTFSQLVSNPQLLSPIGGLETAETVLDNVLFEINRRRQLFNYGSSVEDVNDWNKKYPTKHLPPILLAIDEFNATVLTFGGIRSEFASKATQIAWRGRKYGVTMVIAGQTFEKAIVGPVRDQMITKICFRVANSNISRVILERSGAEKIDVPGRAMTNRWGTIQTYYADSFDQDESEFRIDSMLSQDEVDLIKSVMENNDGKLTYEYLIGLNFSRSEAKSIRDHLTQLGLAEVDKNQNNSLVLVIPPELSDSLQSQHSLQT